LYGDSAAKGTASLLQPSDGLILDIGPRFEGYSVILLTNSPEKLSEALDRLEPIFAERAART
jgi:hypothetical protein